MRRGLSVVGALAIMVAVVVACGGQSQAPPVADQQLPCEVTLTSDCCGGGYENCIGDFASAQQCGNWPTGAKVLVFPGACGGYTAVSVKMTNESFTQYYLYSSPGASLVAIADDAEVNPQGATEIECGAGPSGFSVPAECGQEWLAATSGEACASGTTSKPQSVCQ
jgi:hypothetical protein